jgi:glycosyltransferase XagB
MSRYLREKNNLNPWFSPPSYLSRIIPETIARQFHIAPLVFEGNTIVIGSVKSLTPTQINFLKESIRRPISIIKLTYSEVKRYQAILYSGIPSQPGSPALRPLLEMLSINPDKIILPKTPENLRLADVDPTEWLFRGWINEHQWTQLMGLHHYLPTKTEVTPSPINALTNFITNDQTHYHVNKAFVPLWWARGILYLGVSDLQQIEAIQELVNQWGLRYSFLLIPPTVKAKLLRWVEAQQLFPEVVEELQIAQELLSRKIISPQRLNAARTLKKSAGISIKEALLVSQPDIAKPWLDVKAKLLDTYAIFSHELPGDFEKRLQTYFERIPYQFCKLFQALPLNFANNTMIVGVAEIHGGIIDILSQLSGSEVEARLMSENLIEDWLNTIHQKIEHTINFETTIPDVRALILAKGLIQPDQLNPKEGTQFKGVADYLNHLHSTGWLNEADIAELLAILHRLPSLTLEGVQFDPNLIAEFSQTFLCENHLLPLAKYDHELFVAMADPHDDQNLDVMETETGLKIWPVVVPRTPLEIAINRHVNVISTQESTRNLNTCIDFLIERGVIAEEQRQNIFKDVTERGQLFDRVIQKNCITNGQNLYKLFSEFRNVPFISLKPHEEVKEMMDPMGNRFEKTHIEDPVDWPTARRLDYETAIHFRALPVGKKDGALQIAFATPLYDEHLESLQRILQTELQTCITPREELENAIERGLGKTNIGTLLINAGLISRSELNDALDLAEKTNTRIGQALIHRGYITEDQLYRFLSEQANIPFFDLSNVTLSEEAANILTPDEEWEHGVLPLSIDSDTVLVGVIDPTRQGSIDFIKKKTGLVVRLVLITENDFENALERLYHEHYTNQSVSALLSREPENSAAKVLTTPQIIVLAALVLVSIGLGIWNLKNFLIAINAVFTIFYIMMISYKFVLIAEAISADLEVPVSEEDIQGLHDEQLPIYTILIPVYKEASVLPKLLNAVTKLDYPKIKLDVKVLLEADDQETIQAFKKVNPPDYIQGLIVPTSHPKTKPKACNYGLIRARGEYVVIYDAEDQPEPDRLKKVIAAFKKISPNVICIQSKLNYFNRRQNLLTQWFSSEYSMWFDLFLPGLDARHAPIPLGGTSNHFKQFALVEAGAWDPHNVTEDADLGIRLYKLGYRTRIVDTTTYEEANSNVNNWIRQRSRWVKGYIQTWLVHMRHPFRLIREIGFMAFFSFQMVVGGNIFTVLINPLYWLTTTIWFIFGVDFIDSLFPGIIYILGAISLFFGNFAFTYINVAGAMKRRYFDMVRAALISPLYWGLMSIGGWKGFIQLITNPHYWEKTEHGLQGAEADGEHLP